MRKEREESKTPVVGGGWGVGKTIFHFSPRGLGARAAPLRGFLQITSRVSSVSLMWPAEARWQLQLIAQPRLVWEKWERGVRMRKRKDERRSALFRARRNSVNIHPDIQRLLFQRGMEESLFMLKRMKRRILSFSINCLRCSFWSLAFAFCLFLRWRLVSFSSLGLKQKSLLGVGCKCQPTSCLLFWLSEEKLKFCSLCCVFFTKMWCFGVVAAQAF